MDDERLSPGFKRWYALEEEIKSQCDEFETTVGRRRSCRATLAALDSRHLATVDKVREEWISDGVAVPGALIEPPAATPLCGRDLRELHVDDASRHGGVIGPSNSPSVAASAWPECAQSR